ncbi:spore coat protein H [Entomortierella parvispora]|uniref:Spore coat protein H n=1 Tax=Entomortierella parvispora TaxID=205924 RepID=A0A9P3HJH7_9FUNG|nr:spore coat protein H [Entomortierella parvispora]
MVRLFFGLAAMATVAFADITYNCIGYPTATNGAMGVSIKGAITKLSTNETIFPLWTGVVAGTTSADEYQYVELGATGAAVKTESFTRKLNATTDTHTDFEFFERPVTKHDLPRLPYTYLATYPSKTKAFKEDQIATIHLTAPQAAVDAMNAQPESEADVKVTFRFLNAKTVYTQTNITLKTSGKSSKEFAKQSYKIKFDGDYNQTFFSRPNLKLRSMSTEPTMIREKLYIDMLNSVGVPTQQGSYVRLYVNNIPYGLFLMVDDIKKSFIKQTVYGGDNNQIPGSLIQANAPSLTEQADLAFKGSLTSNYGKDVYTMQNLGNNPATEPLQQLIKFMADLDAYKPNATTNPVGYWTDRLELDGFLRNMALEYLMGAFDNYWMAGSNFFMYFNPKLSTTGKWQWLPTDFDGTFGNGAELDAKASYKALYNFQPDHPLVSKLIIQTPEINTMFNTVLKEIVSTAFKPEAMNARMDGLHKMIALDAAWDYSLKRMSPGTDLKFTIDDFNNNLVNITKDMSAALKPWVQDRADAVAKELGFAIPAGTADRIAPPPRPGKGGKGGDDDDDDGGKASTDNSAMSMMVSTFALVATVVASSLVVLA